MQNLLPVLASPSRVARNEALSIISALGIPRAELFQFIVKRLAEPYRYATYVRTLRKIEKGKALPLLIDHLLERNNESLGLVLRVVGVMEFGDRRDIILKAIQSGNRRDIDNAIEVIETSLHPKIREILIPLLEENPSDEKMALIGKRLGVAALADSPERIFLELLKEEDLVVQALVVYALGEGAVDGLLSDAIEELRDSKAQMVREAAQWTLRGLGGRATTEQVSPEDVNLVEKVVCIRKTPIFNDLRVQEVMAIAGKSSLREFTKGEVVVGEGDPGDALYLIIDGEMTVIKRLGTQQEAVLDRIGRDDFFGEMALLDGAARSASVRVESDASLLVIKGKDFIVAVEDHPSIPLSICRVLARRIRALQGRLPAFESARVGDSLSA